MGLPKAEGSDDMITEIGALVTIVKDLLSAVKNGRDLFGGGSKKATMDTLVKTQQRLEGISEQLHHSVALTKMLPIWLREYQAVDLYVTSPTNEEVKLLDSRLRALIGDSIHDHFSGTFFHLNFAVLPNVDSGIRSFRERLLALEAQLNGIPPGDAVSWRRAWPTLKVRLHDLRVEVEKISKTAEDVFVALLSELRDASAIA
jgi:hypothetical protein